MAVNEVNGIPGEIPQGPSLRTGDMVPESGIYRVIHALHRLPHEVTLLKDESFPRCSQCQDLVLFEVVRTAPELAKVRERIVIYELPVIEDRDESNVA